VSLQVSCIGLLEKDELFCILKTLNGRSYSFQKLSLLSQGNSVLGVRE
jgi:hypothetical protein